MKLYLNVITLSLWVAVATLACAAMDETPKDKSKGSVNPDQLNTPTKKPENGEKNLANEPLPRGQLLYENQCHSCHESTVHIREDHKAKSYADIQYWVGRWSNEVGTKWSADEIDSVVQYLNSTFYHY